MIYNQQEYDIRLEWGLRGVEELAPVSDVIIIVDVLSFSTCVDIVTGNGAIVYPYSYNCYNYYNSYNLKDESAIDYAKSVGAELADFNRNCTEGFSLSPTSLLKTNSKTKLVLPSPNGSTLTLSTGATPTLCGCLRNAKAVANFAKKYGRKISVIPAGEKWADNTLRVAFEDLDGAGAIISYLTGSLSPESKTALAIFESSKANLTEEIKNCISGKELIDRGFENDVLLACELNCSDNIPLLRDKAYAGNVLQN